jgi:hypothetical protein
MSVEIKITGANAQHTTLVGKIIAGLFAELQDIGKTTLTDKGTPVDLVELLKTPDEETIKKFDDEMDDLIDNAMFKVEVN